MCKFTFNCTTLQTSEDQSHKKRKRSKKLLISSTNLFFPSFECWSNSTTLTIDSLKCKLLLKRSFFRLLPRFFFLATNAVMDLAQNQHELRIQKYLHTHSYAQLSCQKRVFHIWPRVGKNFCARPRRRRKVEKMLGM